jgi:ATP-dependent Clp protease ATP-binding subunit ClpA
VAFDRFTGPGKNVLTLAQHESSRLGSYLTDTRHLLLALIHEEDTVGTQVLYSFGIDPKRVRLQAAVRVGPAVVSSPWGRAFTSDAHDVLSYFAAEQQF